MSFPLPRFEAVSRRRFLQSSALAGAVALVPAACGNNDKSALGGGATTTTGPAPTVPSTPASSTAASTASSTASSTAGSAPASTNAPVDPANAFPKGAKLQVNFSFNASDGQARNPYIAVWVETPAGALVQTISLWLLIEKSQYLEHLTRWYNAETTLINAGGTNNLDALAGATRGGGDYQVVWDGTDVDGKAVAKGDYVLCVEAAREHGPYELVTGPITIGAKAFTTKFADNGELSKVSAAFVV